MTQSTANPEAADCRDESLAAGATRFAYVRARLEAIQPRGKWQAAAYEFLLFGFKQGWACLFGGLMLALMLGTHVLYPAKAPLARYDFLVIAAVAVQVAMLTLRLESIAEAKVILGFHLAGTVMELFKTAQGSWLYPETSVLRIGAVPLFSGFMYAAVGSYIARIWRIFDIRLEHYPPRWSSWMLATAIYVNFFAHHWLPDIRNGLFMVCGLLFLRTHFWFTPFRRPRPMPFVLGQALVALFLWFAENLGTLSRSWIYPNQAAGWSMVSLNKLGAWFLLMLLSFALVELLHGDARAKRST